MIESDLLTVSEVMALLRMDRKTLAGHVARGNIAYIEVGLGLKRPRKMFAHADIEAFKEKQRRVGSLPSGLPSQTRRSKAPEWWGTGFTDRPRQERKDERLARPIPDTPRRTRRPKA